MSVAYGLERHGATIGRDLHHAVAIKGTPCALPFIASNAEIAAADDGRKLAGLASAFDFLGVARVEAKLTLRAISLDEGDGNDGRTSFVDELANEGGFVHGLKEGASRLELTIRKSPA